MIDDEFQFEKPEIVENWTWNSECASIVPSFGPKCTKIETDDQHILFRTINLAKKQQAAENQARAASQKKQTMAQNEKKQTKSFLPCPIEKMTMGQLKETLKKIGLNNAGSKEDLVRRLTKFMEK